jgi:hypothetical protein
MRSVAVRLLGISAVVVGVAIAAAAQEPAGGKAGPDPRVGLKPGIKDAGVAASNMELVSALGKPDGFFDPKNPAGESIPPEPPPGSKPEGDKPAPGGKPETEKPETTPAGEKPGAKPGTAKPAPSSGGGMLAFANSDLAFSGNHMIMGNFHGFNTYDVENVRRPKVIASVVCPGGQGDVSIYGNLLFMSVEQTRGRLDCGTGGVEGPVSNERFRGVRIFDVSDLRKPVQIAAVQTCRGSHTHTLVTNPDDKEKIYIYGSGTGSVRPGEELEGCSGLDPKEDPNTALFSIDVIEVPLAAPATAKIVSRPRIFADEKAGTIAGLWPGGDHGEGTQRTSVTNQCHDITVFPSAGLAAGACSGNGILLDISDPVNPKRLDHVSDKNFAYWHSATFNNDATKVIFTDEWGGGTRPRCRATDLPNWGADAIFDIVDKKLQFRGYYKMPAAQTETENCVAHNGSLIPVPGRDIMVQGWYQGGLSVFDFTDSEKPIEIAFFDRGPLDAQKLIVGGYWSTYWHNGNIYGAEIARGLDIFRLLPSDHLSKNEIEAAMLVHREEFNAQEQPKVTWPASSVVARAYMDQLTRTSAIQPEHVSTINAALERVDRLRSGQDRGAEAALGELDTLAGQVESEAASATGRDQARLKALAETLRGRAARLRG